MGRVKAFVGALLAALAFAAPASGQEASILERAAAALQSDSVYIEPTTGMLTEAEARMLRELIAREGNGPIRIAILPAAARDEIGESSTQVALRLGRLVRIAGVYAVVVGNEFRAASTDLGSGRAAHLATEAFDAHRDEGVAAVLADFVRRVGAARGAGRSAPVSDEGSSFWLVGLVIGGAALVGFVFVRRRRRAAELAEVKEAARDDLVALADDVTGLDEDVERNPRAKEAYTRAMEDYQRADDAFDLAERRATSPRSPRLSRMPGSRWKPRRLTSTVASRPSLASRASSTRGTAPRCATCGGTRRTAVRSWCPPASETRRVSKQARSRSRVR
jgi:hypothetical protein